MTTKTKAADVPADYDPSQFPSFAVTVDVVILTMSEGVLHILLVRRGHQRGLRPSALSGCRDPVPESGERL